MTTGPLITPRFLVDDLSDDVLQHPLHTVVAEEEPAGYEAHRFSAGRRDQVSKAITANSDWWHKTTFDRLRMLDMVALWVHNLPGKAYQLQVSSDDFATPGEVVISCTIPTTPGAGDIEDANGVLCENGMWLKAFSPRTTYAYRHFIPAGGAGFIPYINGKCGLSLALNQYDKPYIPSDTELMVTEETNEAGWTGTGPFRQRRKGSIKIKTRSAFEYDQFRYHFEQRFAGGCPMVIVHNRAQAERAVMAKFTGGGFGFRGDADWPDAFRQGEFSWLEVDPREIGATVP